MDDLNDNFNGSGQIDSATADARIAALLLEVEQLQAQVKEARELAMLLAEGYSQFAETLGFDRDMLMVGQVNHNDILAKLKAYMEENRGAQ